MLFAPYTTVIVWKHVAKEEMNALGPTPPTSTK